MFYSLFKSRRYWKGDARKNFYLRSLTAQHGNLFGDIFREPSRKWRQGFVTNFDKDDNKKLADFEAAAKLAGTEVQVEELAYDCRGNLVASYSALYLKDPSKTSLFWDFWRQIEATPKTQHHIVTKQSSGSERIQNSEPKIQLCDCNITILMRHGCQCSGI